MYSPYQQAHNPIPSGTILSETTDNTTPSQANSTSNRAPSILKRLYKKSCEFLDTHKHAIKRHTPITLLFLGSVYMVFNYDPSSQPGSPSGTPSAFHRFNQPSSQQRPSLHTTSIMNMPQNTKLATSTIISPETAELLDDALKQIEAG